MELRSDRMVVVLCGGSNGNHVLVADLARRPEFEVRLITRRPERWGDVSCREQRFLTDSFPMRPCPTWWTEYKAKPHMVVSWDEAHKALNGAHMAIIVGPVSAHEPILKRIFANLPGHPLMVGTAYGQGGFDWTARRLLHDSPLAHTVTLFAMKHYPFLCKASEYGHNVTLYGRYPDLRAAVSPYKEENCRAVKHFLDAMFHKDVHLLQDFVVCTLGATNQVLHPSICAALFMDYEAGKKVYTRHKMFYKEVDSNSQAWMFDLFMRDIPDIIWALDALLKRRGQLRQQCTYEVISTVVSRLPTAIQPRALFSWAIGWAFRNNQRVLKVKAPMIPGTDEQGNAGLVPDTKSRFFTDDTPHGLCVLLGLAEILGVKVPRILFLIRRIQKMLGKCYVTELPDAKGNFLAGPDVPETSAPQAYGVTSKEQLVEFLAWERAGAWDHLTPDVSALPRGSGLDDVGTGTVVQPRL